MKKLVYGKTMSFLIGFAMVASAYPALAENPPSSSLPPRNPDLIIEFLDLPDNHPERFRKFVVILNRDEVNPDAIQKLVEDLRLKVRSYVVSKKIEENRVTRVYEIRDNAVVIKGNDGFDFLLNRPTLFQYLTGEIEINWDRWSNRIQGDKHKE